MTRTVGQDRRLRQCWDPLCKACTAIVALSSRYGYARVVTRVNLGIAPKELCDQHLVAELRELPRVFAYPADRAVPGPFRLGKGHVLWCAQYPGTMADRYRQIVAEMLCRGFAVANPEPRGDGAHAPPALLEPARLLLIERITERLTAAKRPPRWTGRTPPGWAALALEARAWVRVTEGLVGL